jgi:glycosyltransferase involved in cell wall biosynthesis
VEEAGIKDRVIFTGFVTQEEKVALYKGSLSLFFCSLYEGFGLPVLESQSLGVPVITSSASSLPEVAGSGALYADPLDAENMAKRLETIVLNDKLRADLTQKGFENLNRFSWEKTAENLFSIFHGLVHSGSSC